MTGLSLRAQDTVKAIIRELEGNNLSYVVARNYENYPDFGHDLDLFYEGAVSAFEAIAIIVSSEFGWDLVTYCDHWSKSSISEHNIDVFRFYHIPTGEYLQVDLFRGFLVLGIPLMTSKEIIRSRERHRSGLFYSPNILIENIFRLLQINSLVGNKNAKDKVIRYKNRVLECYKKDSKGLLECSKNLGLNYTKESLEYLKSNDYKKFRFFMNKSKKEFFIQSLYRNPVLFIRRLSSRIAEYYRFFYADPCGFEVNIYVENQNLKKKVFDVLNYLKNSNFIENWLEVKSKVIYTKKERKLLERAGVLIRWVNYTGDGVICINKDEKDSGIYLKIQNRIIFRHKVIYEKNEI